MHAKLQLAKAEKNMTKNKIKTVTLNFYPRTCKILIKIYEG